MNQLLADRQYMKKKNKEYGSILVKMMERCNNICVLRVNNNYPHLMQWIESLFCFFEYKNCKILAPQMGYCTEEECDINMYDGLIMLEINLNQPKNELTYRKTTSMKFGIKKFMPTLYLKYDLTFDNEEDPRILDDFVDNGALIVKSEEKQMKHYAKVYKK